MDIKINNRNKLLSVVSTLLILVVIGLNCLPVMALTQSDMISKISEKYSQNTWLGSATTGYTTLNDGMFRHYQNGSIYIGNSVGTACVVTGMIRDKWSSLGWETSFLGYPTTDELATPDGIGRYNHFQHGSIYWYPGAGAHEIHGLIRSKWSSMSWEKGVLGYPISDELVSADGTGRYSVFQKGIILYHPTYGTHYIPYGRLYLNWTDNGSETGSVGYPKSDPYTSNGVPAQDFSRKTISENDSAIKNSVDLRGEINRRGIAIREQGSRGTCVQETMTFLLEYALTGLAGKEFNHMSIDYSTQAGNRATGEKNEDSNFPKYLSGYNTYGTIVNSSWPYNINNVYNYTDWNKKMTPTLVSNGQFMIRKGLKLAGRFIKRDYQGVVTSSQLNDVISCLNKGIPVAQAHAGHAMPIVGYVKNSSEAGGGHLILRNSWGLGAGVNGYETMTFADFKKSYSPGVELYVFDQID